MDEEMESFATPLIKTLYEGHWEEAQRIIACAEYGADILTAGAPGEQPLHIVMSINVPFRQKRSLTNNLQLTKLLVQKGAHLRYCTFPFWHGLSFLPLSELIQCYMDMYESCTGIRPVTGDKDFIGLNGERNLTTGEIQEQMLYLMDIFIRHEANLNVVTLKGIYTSILCDVLKRRTPFIEIVEKVCQAGADINLTDQLGRSPLVFLNFCQNFKKAMMMARYFWKRPTAPDIHLKYLSGRTVLWDSLLVGNTEFAIFLCKKGASGDPKAKIFQQPQDYHVIKAVSALFAPLITNSCTYHESGGYRVESLKLNFKSLLDERISRSLSPVVDMGYLNTPQIQDELMEAIKQYTCFHHVSDSYKIYKNELVPLMMGKINAGLQQLCVRTIVNQVFFASSKFIEEGAKPKNCNIWLESDYYRIHMMKPMYVVSLVEKLGLPKPFQVFFEIEAAKIHLTYFLYRHVNVLDVYKSMEVISYFL